MILDRIELLNTKRIVLASGSPRRKEILSSLGLRFEIRVSGFAEDLDAASFESPDAYVRETARIKAFHTLQALEAANEDNVDLIITADTIVVLDDEVIGKPIDAADATATLARLSDRSHRVVSAIVLLAPQRRSDTSPRQPRSTDEPLTIVASESTEVHFASLSESDIAAYVQTGDPMDKAGSYGIQSLASTIVRGIHGCYFNVVGFPVHLFAKTLRNELLDRDLL